MIAQFRMLSHVKRLREDKALRVLEKARSDLRLAHERAARLSEQVAESARTLPERERAEYRPLLGKIVETDDIEAAKARVLDLDTAHRKLEDKLDRAREHVRRCQERLDSARLAYKAAQAATEKTETMRDRLIEEAELEAIFAEEAEIEDIFARPRPLPFADTGADSQ